MMLRREKTEENTQIGNWILSLKTIKFVVILRLQQKKKVG